MGPLVNSELGGSVEPVEPAVAMPLVLTVCSRNMHVREKERKQETSVACRFTITPTVQLASAQQEQYFTSCTCM